MAEQVPLSSKARADDPQRDLARHDGTIEIAPDLAYRRLAIVNVVFVGHPHSQDGAWVLIDAGLPATAGLIRAAAMDRFGGAGRPAAIVLTHGHFDHVGVLEELAQEWDIPVYAHALEAPYLNGQASYPPPDPSVGGGFVAWSSPLFPTSPVNVGSRLRLLPEDGSIPEMPGWQWIHTPGHAPGHVSFWRQSDRTLIVGDAFITTAQESAYAVVMQTPEMHGPPMYFTIDWQASAASVRTLSDLEPELVVTGHGRAMRGVEMRTSLSALARDFEKIAVPADGTYVSSPARADDGSAYRAVG